MEAGGPIAISLRCANDGGREMEGATAYDQRPGSSVRRQIVHGLRYVACSASKGI